MIPLRSALATMLLAAAALGAPSPAAAEGPFDPATTLGPLAGWPSVAMTSDGDAFVAWAPAGYIADTRMMDRGGVFLSWRAAGESAWQGPARIHEGTAASVAVAANERGDVVVAWHRGADDADPATPSPQDLELRVFSGGAWGPLETVPQPPLEPRRDGNGHAEDSRITNYGPSVAIAPDGTVAVAWNRTDDAAETRRMLAALRPPGGPIGAPQTLGDAAGELHEIAADGNGRITVAWSQSDRGSPERNAGIQVAERAPGAPAFGEGARVAQSTAYDSRADLAVNRRGDALLTWGDGAVVRTPDGVWGPVQALQTTGNTTSALNERGDAMVTWPGGALYAQYRPAGGAFGPVVQERYEGMAFRNPAALDAFGTAVVLLPDWGPARTERLVGHLRHRDGPFRRVDATPAESEPTGATMATDAFGNGVLAYADNGTHDVMAVDYSASAPQLTEVGALPGTAFRFRVSEPARVRATLWRGRRKVATIRARAGAGRNRITASRKLRRGTRYVARIRAFDAGRRASKPVRLRFRAR